MKKRMLHRWQCLSGCYTLRALHLTLQQVKRHYNYCMIKQKVLTLQSLNVISVEKRVARYIAFRKF